MCKENYSENIFDMYNGKVNRCEAGLKDDKNPLKLYLFIASLYILLVIVLPANKAAMKAYNLESFTYHLILLLAIVPSVITWFFAFYSYYRLKTYASAVSNTPEGSGFAHIAKGNAWLAVGISVSAILSICLNTIANSHPGFLNIAIIINHYALVIVPLFAFSYIGQGARHLAEHTRAHLSVNAAKAIVLIFAVLGAVFCYLVFRRLNLHDLTSADNAYYLPAWLIITTIIIPCLYAWFAGLLAAYEMVVYSRHVAGVFYRQSMHLVAGGLLLVILSSVGLEYLRAAVPRTGHLSLNMALVVTYLIYLVMGAGYALVSVGARRLKRIEEI